MADWEKWDALAGNEISLELPTGIQRGIVRGVDESGALLLANAGRLQHFHSGEVSVKEWQARPGNTP